MTVKRWLLDWICPAKTFSDPDRAFDSTTSLAGRVSLKCTYSIMRSHFLFSALEAASPSAEAAAGTPRCGCLTCMVLRDTLWQCYETLFGMKDAACQAFCFSFFISLSNHLIRLLLLLNSDALAGGSRSNQIERGGGALGQGAPLPSCCGLNTDLKSFQAISHSAQPVRFSPGQTGVFCLLQSCIQ